MYKKVQNRAKSKEKPSMFCTCCCSRTSLIICMKQDRLDYIYMIFEKKQLYFEEKSKLRTI